MCNHLCMWRCACAQRLTTTTGHFVIWWYHFVDWMRMCIGSMFWWSHVSCFHIFICRKNPQIPPAAKFSWFSKPDTVPSMEFRRESLTHLALQQLAMLLFWIFHELLRRCDYLTEWEPSHTFRASFSTEFAEEFNSTHTITLRPMTDAATQTDESMDHQDIPSPGTPDPFLMCFERCARPWCRFQCLQTEPHDCHLCVNHRPWWASIYGLQLVCD